MHDQIIKFLKMSITREIPNQNKERKIAESVLLTPEFSTRNVLESKIPNVQKKI